MPNERLKLWLDLGKWMFGTFVLGAASIWINADLQSSRLELEQNKQAHDIELAKLEQERVFLESFVSHAMSKEILGRIRLAHYIKTTTTDPNLRAVWSTFYEELLADCKAQYEKASSDHIDLPDELAASTTCDVGGIEEIQGAAAYMGTRNMRTIWSSLQKELAGERKPNGWQAVSTDDRVSSFYRGGSFEAFVEHINGAPWMIRDGVVILPGHIPADATVGQLYGALVLAYRNAGWDVR